MADRRASTRGGKASVAVPERRGAARTAKASVEAPERRATTRSAKSSVGAPARRASTRTAKGSVLAPERRGSTRTVEAPERTSPRTAKALVEAPDRPAERRRSTSLAARRAFARRANREGRRPEPLVGDERSAGRASFVILIISLLTVGVAATLWLSTQAIADSYRLEEAKERASELAERAAELQREVTKSESASELDKRARAQGMVPAGDPARLVVQPDGRVVVVGEPTRATKPAKPKPSAGTTPGDG